MIAKLSFVASMLVASAAAIGDSHRTQANNNVWRIPDYSRQDEWTGLCMSGMRQSPINIITADSTTRYGDFQLRGSGFRNMAHKILNTDGHQMWMEIDEGRIWASDRDEKPVNYRPYELSLKSPSEHRLNGQQMDLELQIPMYTEGGDTTKPSAVISVFFDSARSYFHSEFAESMGIMDVTSRRDTTVASNVNLADFINSLDVSTYYEYEGSITEPPCTEGVTWYVIPNIKSLSMRQSRQLARIWREASGFYGQGRGNNRAIQNTNARNVFSSNNKLFPNPNGASALIAGLSATVLAATLAF